MINFIMGVIVGVLVVGFYPTVGPEAVDLLDRGVEATKDLVDKVGQ
jgi:hypothetical protein